MINFMNAKNKQISYLIIFKQKSQYHYESYSYHPNLLLILVILRFLNWNQYSNRFLYSLKLVFIRPINPILKNYVQIPHLLDLFCLKYQKLFYFCFLSKMGLTNYFIYFYLRNSINNVKHLTHYFFLNLKKFKS